MIEFDTYDYALMKQGQSSTKIEMDLEFTANIYLFKVNNRNTKKRCKICSKLTIKTPEQGQWRCSGVSIVNLNFTPFSSVCIVDLEEMKKQMLAGLCAYLETSFKHLR